MSELPSPQLFPEEPREAERPRAGDQPRPAGFWVRALAMMIDGVILAIVGTPLVYLYFNDLVAYQLTSWIVSFSYFALLQPRMGGSFGKKAMGLRLVSEDLGPVTPGQGILRYFMSMVSGMFLFLGYLWVVFDERKQSWHDKVARTLVVRAPVSG